MTLPRLDSGDALTDVVWPVVSMADSVGWEWFGAFFDRAMWRELMGVDVEEVEIAIAEEGAPFGWGGGVEEGFKALLEGGEGLGGEVVTVQVVEVQVVVESCSMVDAKGGIDVTQEVAVGGSGVTSELLEGEEEGVGVDDEEGRVAEWVEFKAEVVGVGFSMVDGCGYVALDWWEEMGAGEDGGGFLHFPVGSVEDFGDGN